MSERFKNWKMPRFAKNGMTKYGWCCPDYFNLDLNKNTDIGFGTFIDAYCKIIIEEGAQIGPHCAIFTHNTITPMEGSVIIKKGAKIGAYSLILPNVIIKENEYISERSTVYINKEGERIIK
jgi:acetyltransferase-like isoleucine patch superfamily enzyme